MIEDPNTSSQASPAHARPTHEDDLLSEDEESGLDPQYMDLCADCGLDPLWTRTKGARPHCSICHDWQFIIDFPNHNIAAGVLRRLQHQCSGEECPGGASCGHPDWHFPAGVHNSQTERKRTNH
eukprot:TRINITY_DN227_c0_g1_i1.p1 TRINITY_DN227_c0_g1~~TRINITY_DN227_c0_g1_i1.p1  ORF type:complete len:124 (+),score=12.66 TRINITY_DN227_c0_g1_i1:44-415(+)